MAELDRFRERVGAPPQALQLGNRRYPHLDLKLEPRERALADPQVRVFERTSDMLRYLKSMRAGNVPGVCAGLTRRMAHTRTSTARTGGGAIRPG